MNELDIKPGQTWLRRDGGKARIYATDGMGLYSIHGATKVEGGWKLMSWDASGSFYPIEPDFDYDLIRLYDWREGLKPIWTVLNPRFICLAMDENQEWYCYEDKPSRNEGSYLATIHCKRMDELFEMPTPDCPWYETLTMRPEA